MNFLAKEHQNIGQEIAEQVLRLSPKEIVPYVQEPDYQVLYVQEAHQKPSVLRLYNEKRKDSYEGSLRWLPTLRQLGIPVPQPLASGKWGEVYYTHMSHLPGQSLEKVYPFLSDEEKHQIAKDVVEVMHKVRILPQGEAYGYTLSTPQARWVDVLRADLKRYQHLIVVNGVFTASVCEETDDLIGRMEDYLDLVLPSPFLLELAAENLLIRGGQLEGIVGIDMLCYGDHFQAIGDTRMALVDLGQDTAYIDHLLFELKAKPMQRRAAMLYTLLSCVGRMAEERPHFREGTQIPVTPERVTALGKHYTWLRSTLEMML